MVRPTAPRHAVDQPTPFERLAESLTAIGLVGEIARLVVLDQRFRQTGVVNMGWGHLGLADKTALFIHRQMRLVAEMDLLRFIVTRASGSRGLTPPLP